MVTRNLIIILLCLSFKTQAQTAADSVQLSVYPNPSSGIFNIGMQSPVNQKVGITILNLMGQAIVSDSQQLVAGNNTVQYDLSSQKTGMYVVRVSGQDWAKITKIYLLKNNTDSLDIVHYDLSLSIRNLASKTIAGKADITFAITTDSVSTVRLDLLKLTADSITLNGNALSFNQTDSTLTVLFPASQTQGDTIVLSVYYQGQPVTDASWGGFYFNGDYAYNMGVGFTSNPHNFGRCWFPCFDNFTDRATYSFHITTDDGFKGVCNGLMLPETVNGDGSTTWNWEMNQPIPTYLASVAVGKYEFVKYEFQGQNRTYPVWLAVTAADTAKARASFVNLNNALSCFESKFGAYPFDRVGYVGVPFNSGAMEHASNIAYPLYAINGNIDYETLFAHELSHMWWGDQTTCSTAEDMWLNEGWASFCEALFLECLYGKEAYTNDIKAKTNNVLLNAPKDDGGWLPVSGVPHEATYGTHVYKKGALMVHTLRTIMGDSAFFAACRAYQQQYRFKDVSSEDLKNAFQPFTGIDLNAFFQKWIYSPGHSDIVVDYYTTSTRGTSPQDKIVTYTFHLIEIQRKNVLISTELPFTFTCYSNQFGFTKTLNGKLINGRAILEVELGQLTPVAIESYVINQDYAEIKDNLIDSTKYNTVYLGKTSEQLIGLTTGVHNLPNVLLSLNVKKATTDRFYAVHHWVGPTAGNTKKKGIRISEERYWSIDGPSSSDSLGLAFFDYNGSANAYLDSELIQQTEDSLVLLYRKDVNTDWQIHTDNAFLPGVSKTDKIGRFRVNNLVAGEYAFGMRDYQVTGLNDIHQPQTVSVVIRPNPIVDDSFQFELSKTVRIENLRIVNSSGKTVWRKQLNQTTNTGIVPADQLPAGIYILIVESGNQSFTAKFTRP